METFYNRETERKDIPKQIRERIGRQQIIILAGTTGVGKSCLVEKLLRDELADFKSVTVYIGKSSVNTIENLSYFNGLYHALASLAKKRRDYKLKTTGQYGRRNFLNWLRIIWGAIQGYLNIDTSRHIAEPVEEYSVSRKKEYIVSVLRNGPFIINVQNIQNIDIQSLEIFQNITSNIPDLIWMFEYTLTDSDMDNEFYSFVNECRRISPICEVYNILKLDFDLAFNLVPSKARKPFYRKRLQEQYEKANGNLLSIMVVPQNLDNDSNYMRSKLALLNQDEKYIAYILFLNEGPLSENALYSILTKINTQGNWGLFSTDKIEQTLQELLNANIIKKREQDYSIRHDSVSTVLSEMPANPALFLAFRALEFYYQEKLERQSGTQEDCIQHLFSLYVRFHDKKLIELFPRLWDLISAAKYPKDIMRKIEMYKQHIVTSKEMDLRILYPVARFLTEICIRLQYPEEAQKNLDLIYNIRPSQYLIGLQGAICALRSSQDNWEQINLLIANAGNKKRLKLSLCLCRLRIMMRTCGSGISKAYTEELLKCPEYRDTPEYGFLLYNYAEFMDDPHEALHYYQEAMRIFREHNLPYMAAEVNVSMGMSYGYLGQLKKAYRALRRAAQIAPHHIPETVLLNNLAAIDILGGKASASVINKLSDAVLMDNNPYEILIIKCNWLVALILQGYIDQAASLALDIEKSNYENFQYEDFLHIVYQDLYYYYDTVHNSERATFYCKKLEDLAGRKGISEWTRTLINLMLSKKKVQENFYSQFPFRVDFLGFWGVSISRDLENYQ